MREGRVMIRLEPDEFAAAMVIRYEPDRRMWAVIMDGYSGFRRVDSLPTRQDRLEEFAWMVSAGAVRPMPAWTTDAERLYVMLGWTDSTIGGFAMSEESVNVDWLEDSPTRVDHANQYGQHGRTVDGTPMVRMVWPDGTPAGEWSVCELCGPDGLHMVEEED